MLREFAREMDPVHPPDSLRELWELHRWLDPASAPSLARLRDRHEDPQRRKLEFLNQNTWLMDVGALADTFSVYSKPAVGERASELGSFLRSNVGLALLQEVWEPQQREELLAGWGSPAPAGVAHGEDGIGVDSAATWSFAGGPLAVLLGSADSVLGDGLTVLYRDFELERVDRLSFEAEASAVEVDVSDVEFEVEALAEKGVLRATVPVPVADGLPIRLEVFTTHLFAPGGPDGDALRHRQIDELAEFIAHDPSPGGLRIVAGDFNTTPSSANHTHLVGRMEALGMEEILGGVWGRSERMTKPFHTGTPHPARADDDFPPAPGEPLFADDGFVADSTKRLDYCFVERPRPSIALGPGARTHSFDLDFARPRRLRLQRPASAAEVGAAPLISDHLGIMLTLFLYPR